VTPRRWLHCCNPELSELISEKVGDLDEWITNLTLLRDLAQWSDDQKFITDFIRIKRDNKLKL